MAFSHVTITFRNITKVKYETSDNKNIIDSTLKSGVYYQLFAISVTIVFFPS